MKTGFVQTIIVLIVSSLLTAGLTGAMTWLIVSAELDKEMASVAEQTKSFEEQLAHTERTLDRVLSHQVGRTEEAMRDTSNVFSKAEAHDLEKRLSARMELLGETLAGTIEALSSTLDAPSPPSSSPLLLPTPPREAPIER